MRRKWRTGLPRRRTGGGDGQMATTWQPHGNYVQFNNTHAHVHAHACADRSMSYLPWHYAGAQCWCGHTFDASTATAAPLSDCSAMQCATNTSEGCGGSDRILVYTATCTKPCHGQSPLSTRMAPAWVLVHTNIFLPTNTCLHNNTLCFAENISVVIRLKWSTRSTAACPFRCGAMRAGARSGAGQ